MSDNSDSINREIAIITKQIDTLVLDFNRQTKELKNRLEQLKSDKRATKTNNQESTALQLGDTVAITNNYLYKKGTKGVIVKLTKTRVTLRDTNNTLHTRSCKNVRKQIEVELDIEDYHSSIDNIDN